MMSSGSSSSTATTAGTHSLFSLTISSSPVWQSLSAPLHTDDYLTFLPLANNEMNLILERIRREKGEHWDHSLIKLIPCKSRHERHDRQTRSTTHADTGICSAAASAPPLPLPDDQHLRRPDIMMMRTGRRRRRRRRPETKNGRRRRLLSKRKSFLTKKRDRDCLSSSTDQTE